MSYGGKSTTGACVAIPARTASLSACLNLTRRSRMVFLASAATSGSSVTVVLIARYGRSIVSGDALMP